MENETNIPPKKTYLEAALTPVTSPVLGSINPLQASPFMIGKKVEKTGIIDTRIKWYINDYNPDETCSKCKKGIEDVEWNSYYTVYVKRFRDIMGEYRVKIYNNHPQKNKFNKDDPYHVEDCELCDDNVYCDSCKKEITDKFMEDKKQKQIRLPFSTPMLEAISIEGGVPPITINTPMLEGLKGIDTMPNLKI
jgi:hypothetical protein